MKVLARIATLTVASVTALVPISVGASTAQATVKYKNCANLNKMYHHGVGRTRTARDKATGKRVTNFYVSKALYDANKKLDRDKDSIACEKR
jgi:hypothetical protein